MNSHYPSVKLVLIPDSITLPLGRNGFGVGWIQYLRKIILWIHSTNLPN